MKKIVRILFLIINEVISKNNRKYVFFSLPDFQGNSRAFFEFLYNTQKDNIYIWLFYKENKKLQELISKRYPGLRIYYIKSLIGVFHYMTSKYIFSTHKSFLGIKSRKQKHIELWHGMPIKSMGYMENTPQDVMYADKIDILISTSYLTRNLLAACFKLEGEKIKVIGQPRCDYLNKKNIRIKEIFKIKKNEKIIGYFPTFREGFTTRKEGESIVANNFLRTQDYCEKKLCKFLEENNLKLIVKLHPYEEKIYSNLYINTRNIIFLTTRMLEENLIDLYEVLDEVDILVTDYSSIFIDYLVTKKPIIFLIPDFIEYRNKRGLLLEPIEDWLPGNIVLTQKELQNKILKNLLKKDSLKKESVKIKYFNMYSDNKNSERLLNEVKKF